MISRYLLPCLLFDTQPHIATPSRFVVSSCGLCNFQPFSAPSMMATLCVHGPAPWNLGLGCSREPCADPCRDLFLRPWIAEKGLFSVVVLPSVYYGCYASPSMIFYFQGRKRRGMLCRRRVYASPTAEALTPAGTIFLGPVGVGRAVEKVGRERAFA